MEINKDLTFSFDINENLFDSNVTKTNEINCDIKRNINLEKLIDEHRENLDTEDNVKILEEDSVRTVTAIFQKKTKTTDKTEEEAFNFKDVMEEYNMYESFLEMKKISKPILKALTENGLYKPTPIQAACIPTGLLGRDICACAQTGSGKTLAFIIPIVERLLRGTRPQTHSRYVQPRAVIISPTRELAMQTHSVTAKLLKYAGNLTQQLVTGGLKRSEQEEALRYGADIVIATPGRLIDLVHNTPNFDLRKIQFLVLDEADKVLDPHFIDQSEEIVRQCCPTRQVFLFSATMTESVKKLAGLSLKQPVKIFLNQNSKVAELLEQEFVRVRTQRQSDREAMLVSLVCRQFGSKTIVFMPTKNHCHRMHILLGLLGIRCGELHSNMTQAQRLDALSRFAAATKMKKPEKEETEADVTNLDRIDVLVGTDLASRGLDICSVETVINYQMPRQYEQYVHRVGRTARNQCTGRAISLVHENDRIMLKKVKANSQEIRMRKIEPEVVQFYAEKIAVLEKSIQEIIIQERITKESEDAEIEMEKAEQFLTEGLKKKNEIVNDKRFCWFSTQKPGGGSKRKNDDECDAGERDAKKRKIRKADVALNPENKIKPKAFSKKIQKESIKKKNPKGKMNKKK